MSWPPWIDDAVLFFNRAVLVYFLSLNGIYLVLFLLSLRRIWQFVRRTFFSDYRQMMESEMTWPISVLVPAFNEEKTIVETIRSLMMVNYTEFEIIVINDGSTDTTLRMLIETFGLRSVDRVYRRSLATREVRGIYSSLEHPHLIVVDKEQGGKADALNAGINLSRYPLFCSIDADSMIEDNALLRVVKPFMERPEETVAVGGIVRIANGCRVRDGRVTRIELPDRALPILQAVEYLRAFLTGRVGWSALQSLLIISGAFGLYNKRRVIQIGGYSTRTDTEDMELVARLHRFLARRGEKYRVVFVPDPVCWTEVPSTLRTLGRQRTRWHRGLAQTLWANRGMLFNPRYGAVGLFAFPYFFVFEMLGPFVETLGYLSVGLSYLLGLLSIEFFLLFLLGSVVFGSLLSIGAVLLEELSFRRYPYWLDLVKLIVFGVLENLGYRQLLSLYKIKSFWELLMRRRTWGRQERRGFARGDDPDLPAAGRPGGGRGAAGVAGSLLLGLALGLGAAPADGGEARDPDTQLRQALDLSRRPSGRAAARELCGEILERNPGYADARVLLGRILAWDGQYDAAREELRRVLEAEPDHADGRLALIDLEIWSDRPEEVLELARRGLEIDPASAAYQARRSWALERLGREDEALEAARRAWDAEPAPAHRRQYLRLLEQSLPNKISADYDVERFDDDTDPWHLLSLSYRRRAGFGEIIGRANLARRFDENGAQFEVDAYPRIRRRSYLYLNLGLSSSDLFPERRYGAEAYHDFRGGWEASLGLRRLEFAASDITIYTGTIAKYLGRYWISWRPDVVHDSDGDSFSSGVTARRYFAGRYEYAELSVGRGSDSHENLITRERENLDAFRARAELRRRIGPRTLLGGSVGYRRQELEFDRRRRSWLFGIGVERDF